MPYVFRPPPRVIPAQPWIPTATPGAPPAVSFVVSIFRRFAASR